MLTKLQNNFVVVMIGLIIGGSLILAGCAQTRPAAPPTPTPPAINTPAPAPTEISQASAAQKPITLTVMSLSNEVTPAYIAAFEAANPDIRIQFIEYSQNLLDVGLVNGDLPDIFRLLGGAHLPLVKKGLLLDITDYITRSKVITFDDIVQACTDSVIVNGRYYGFPNDWPTPEFTSLYVYNTAFEEAGLSIPSTTEPLTYAELAGIAKKLTAKHGRPAYYTFAFERTVSEILAQCRTSMFNEDFTEMHLTDNPKAMEVMRYFYDLAVSGVMHVTPLNPDIGFSFFDGKLPITQFGYWMGALVTPKTAVYGKVTMLPGPVWDRSLPRVYSTSGSAKLVISAATKQPEAAYRFVEWYVAGLPGIERARTGWGFPTLRSMDKLLPRETAFDRQRLEIILQTLKHPSTPLPEYPYRSIEPTFNQSWTRNIELAQAGQMTFEEFASNLQEEVNLAILNEINQAGSEPSK